MTARRVLFMPPGRGHCDDIAVTDRRTPRCAAGINPVRLVTAIVGSSPKKTTKQAAPQKNQLREQNSEINFYFTRVISAKNEVDIGGYGPTQDRAFSWMPIWKRAALSFNSVTDG